ncbi:hypothetical protein Tco_1503318 [Tanacetum coccineum]
MCIDYRKLNKLTVKNRYPLLRIDDLFDQLQGSSVYSKIDLRSGYHQLRVRDEDISKTAFRTCYGHYECMDCLSVTNVPTYSWTFRNMHATLLRLILELLKKEEYVRQFSNAKCGLLVSKIAGHNLPCAHVIDSEGIYVDPAKIESIMEWESPKTPA